MAVFQPSSNLRIGQVPWDNTYQHVRWYTSPEQQYNEIVAHCDSQFSSNDYTYIRQNSAIRVPYNAERLYNYNYVVYKNANYGDRYFYAFITEVNYINENTTELVIETDVWQTYMFQISWKPAFVERCHVGDDTLGTWRNPEPEMPLEYIYQRRWSDSNLNDDNKMWTVIQTNAVPHYKEGIWPPTVTEGDVDGSDAVVGGWYCNTFSGGKYFAFDKNDGGHGSDYGIFAFLDAMNKAGAAESISNIFMFSQEFIPRNQRGQDWGLPEDTGGYGYEKSWSNRPTNLNGYVPKNNKCFLYPYCFCRIDNNNGQSIDIKFEDWEAPYTWSVQTTLDPDATIFVIPQNYQGIENNVPSALTFQASPKCSWNYSAYQTWSAQNSLSNLLTVGADIVMMAYPAARGVGAAGKALLKTTKVAKNYIARGGNIARKTFTNVAGKNMNAAVSSTMGKADMLSMAAGALGLGNFIGEVNKQSKVPDVQKGIASGNTLFGLHYMTYNVSDVCIRKEYAQILDNFFDKYGYSIENIQEAPHPTVRRNWYYYKTQDAQHKGNMPAPELALINECCDSGITFWNTWDIANYKLANDIVN